MTIISIDDYLTIGNGTIDSTYVAIVPSDFHTISYYEHSIRKDGWIPYHSIKIKKNTILHQLLDIEEYTVSSTHHQCIKKLGMNIVASAYSADGIVEAIELCSDKQKIIGFQGHIENILTNYTEYNKIIKYILS